MIDREKVYGQMTEGEKQTFDLMIDYGFVEEAKMMMEGDRMKKFELTTVSKMHLGRKLFRVKALISFGNVKEGELGGYIEKEDNLSQTSFSWVYGNAMVYGDAEVYDNAVVYGVAEVYDNAKVRGNAVVRGNAKIYDNAMVRGDAVVCHDADYVTIHGFGSCYRTTTFFRCKNSSIKVACGCFFGTLGEFRTKVKDTHGDSKFAKEYLAIADLMELHFSKEEAGIETVNGGHKTSD